MADPIVAQNSTRMSCEVVKFLSPVAPLCGTIKTVALAVLSTSCAAGKKELDGQWPGTN